MHQHINNHLWEFESGTVTVFLFINMVREVGILWLLLVFPSDTEFHEIG